MTKMKLGYLALSKASWMTPRIEAIAADTHRNLQTLDAEILYDGVTVTEAEAGDRARQFASAGVDGVIMHFATFPVGAAVSAAAMELDVPILLLANPEEAGPGQMWEQNSFCGANMAAHGLRRLAKPYSFVFGHPAETVRELAASLAALRVRRALRRQRVGLIGGRVPGFYTSNCDELQLRRDLGTTVEVVDQLEVVRASETLSDDEIAVGREALGKIAKRVNQVDDAELLLAARLYVALGKTTVKYRLTSLAVRCWPEWGDLFGIAPCAVIGMLNDHGLLTSCEGDVTGAVSMELLRAAAGDGLPFFVDLIQFDYERNTGVVWHCGAAPSGLCRRFDETQLRKHMRVDGGDKKGVTNDFALKPGRITLAKYDTDVDGRQRLLLAAGEAMDTEPFIRGNPLRIRFDGAVKNLVGAIMDKGFEHHYAVIHADVAEPLRHFARWQGIELVEPELK